VRAASMAACSILAGTGPRWPKAARSEGAGMAWGEVGMDKDVERRMAADEGRGRQEHRRADVAPSRRCRARQRRQRRLRHGVRCGRWPAVLPFPALGARAPESRRRTRLKCPRASRAPAKDAGRAPATLPRKSRSRSAQPRDAAAAGSACSQHRWPHKGCASRSLPKQGWSRSQGGVQVEARSLGWHEEISLGCKLSR
jgi:hypothetical protein